MIYDSFYGLCIETRLNENLLLILNFSFIAFILGWKANFLIMELTVSFLDDIEVSSGQLKRFNESVIDSKCLLKVERGVPFVLITIHPFPATLYFLVYSYFYLKSRVYMISKMVWNYSQHLVSQSTAIWFVYSDLSPGFTVA